MRKEDAARVANGIDWRAGAVWLAPVPMRDPAEFEVAINATREAFDRRLTELCQWGHRGSGTEEERLAAEYLQRELEGMKIQAELEPFRVCPSMALRFLVHVGLGGVALFLLWHAPLATLALSLAAAVSLVAEQTAQCRWLGRWLPHEASQNVVARLSVNGTAHGRVILSAHYDTQRTGLIWKVSAWSGWLLWRMPALLQSPLLIVAVVMIAQAAAAWWVVVHGPGAAVGVFAGAALVFHAALGWLLWNWYRSPFVAGAADNGSGVAAALALTEAWRRAPVPGIELIVLLPGCEESGLLGAAAWLDRHREELGEKPVRFLNLDGLAFGDTRYLGQEAPGCGLPLPFQKPMLALARRTAQENGLKHCEPCVLPGPTDGLAFLVRGFEGITLVGCQDGGELPYYHTPQDVPERMNREAAWQGALFGWRVLRRLAEEMPGKFE